MKKTQHTVLVIDDEKSVRQSIKMLLKDKYSVLLAVTGEESIEVLRIV